MSTQPKSRKIALIGVRLTHSSLPPSPFSIYPPTNPPTGRRLRRDPYSQLAPRFSCSTPHQNTHARRQPRELRALPIRSKYNRPTRRLLIPLLHYVRPIRHRSLDHHPLSHRATWYACGDCECRRGSRGEVGNAELLRIWRCVWAPRRSSQSSRTVSRWLWKVRG